jgi:ABC-2 type transport system permease protein
MIFFAQLRGELRKLFSKPRTWIGYGAFLAMEVLILFVYKLDRAQANMRGTLGKTACSSTPTTVRSPSPSRSCF